MFNKPFLHIWVVGVLCCTLSAALVYTMMPPERGSFFQQVISWFLLPGVALYVQLNGSLLFGGGFGKIGNFIIIAMGSALTWSIPIPFVVRGISWLWFRYRRHR